MSKEIRAIIIGVFSALAAVGVVQWMGSNIAFQIGGSNNKIDQKMEPRNQSPSTEKISPSNPASQVTEGASSPSNAQIEQHLKKIEEQLKTQKTKAIVKSDCNCDDEEDTNSDEEEDEVEDPAGP